MKSKILTIFLSLLFITGVVQGSETDIPNEMRNPSGTRAHGSYPSDFIVCNDINFFLAEDRTHGRELWRSDGTESGTYLVKDVYPGKQSSKIKLIGAMKEFLYFSAEDDSHGRDLWRSDGTPEGTYLVKDMEPSLMVCDSGTVVMGDDELYYFAYGGKNNHSLWVSNGTRQGTQMIKDGLRGGEHFYPNHLTLIDDDLYFISQGNIWKSDGTLSGTHPIVSNESNTPLKALKLMPLNETLYYIERNEKKQISLYVSDGTYEGKRLVKTIGQNINEHIDEVILANNMLYFKISFFSGNENKYQLWRSDGTSNGTILLKDGLSSIYLRDFVEGRDQTIYFGANDGVSGYELWKSDGTPDGTGLIKDISSGSKSAFPRSISRLGNSIYFVLYVDNTYSLWRSDGTAENTVMLDEIGKGNNAAISLFSSGSQMFMSQWDWNHGTELWKWNPNLNTSVLVKDIKWDSVGSKPEILYQDASVIFFSAYDSEHGRELWKSDGTIKGTHLVKDIYKGVESGVSSFPLIAFHNGVIYFYADDGIHGSEVWRSDGTDKGTWLVKDISPNSMKSIDFSELESEKKSKKEIEQKIEISPKNMRNKSFPLYLSLSDSQHGYELWRFDGTDKGTYMIKDIRKGPKSSYPSILADIDGTLYLLANDGLNGYAVWKSDGTEKGTVLLKRLYDSKKNWELGRCHVIGNQFFYIVDFIDETINGYVQNVKHLMRLDIVKGEVHFVKELCSACYLNDAYDLTPSNGLLYYFMDNDGYDSSEFGCEIDVSDGTTEGTFTLMDGYGFKLMRPVNGKMMIFKDNKEGLTSLFASDGTLKGTMMLKTLGVKDHPQFFIRDIFEFKGKTHILASHSTFDDKSVILKLLQTDGTKESTVEKMMLKTAGNRMSFSQSISNNAIFFGTSTENAKSCLWKSDGTDKGTVIVKKFESSDRMESFMTVNGNTIFNLFDHQFGSELWRSDGTKEGTFRITGEGLAGMK